MGDLRNECSGLGTACKRTPTTGTLHLCHHHLPLAEAAPNLLAMLKKTVAVLENVTVLFRPEYLLHHTQLLHDAGVAINKAEREESHHD